MTTRRRSAWGSRAAMTGLLLALAGLQATPLHAQALQAGGTGAVTSIGGDLGASGQFSGFGVEACVACAGARALFVEYTHAGLAEPRRPDFHRYTRRDVAGFGLRLQARSGRVRRFFDVGVGFGEYHGTDYGTLGIIGVVAGTGVTIQAGRRIYVRPQVRLYWMSVYDLGLAASIGVGVRF